jgi:putative hemolysin
VNGTPVSADARAVGEIALEIRCAQADQSDRAHEDRRFQVFVEQVDRQVALRRADHHPGNDSVA